MANQGGKLPLRRVLTAIVGLLLVTVGITMAIVLGNAGATAEMRKEAQEAVLLAEMDSALQDVAIEVDAWVSGALVAADDRHPVLSQPEIQAQLEVFWEAAAELEALIKPEEKALVTGMGDMFTAYQTALVELRASERRGDDIVAAWLADVQSIERSFRDALLDLQNEEIEHLAVSVSEVRDAEAQLRFLVPALLVLIVVLAAGIRRLASRAQRFEEAEALNQARTQFIASVSHEVRTPLTSVVGLSHEMRDSLDDFTVDEIQGFAELIAEASSEVAGIVEDLLVAARAQAGDLKVIRESVDLRDQVEHLLETERLLADETVTITGDATAVADSARVRQILRNLLTNASRYGGRHVEIGLERCNGTAQLVVADDGPGIPREHRERIFQPFERAYENPGVPTSVGLGLTVSRQLCEAMGGSLAYEFNGRSVLRVTLPAAHEAPARDLLESHSPG